MSVTTIATTIVAATMLAGSIYTNAGDTATTSTSSGYTRAIENQSPLIQKINELAIKQIENIADLPDVKYIPEVVDALSRFQPELEEKWNELVREQKIIVKQKDEEGRPFTVLIQAVVEKVFSSLKKEEAIEALEGSGLTPMPLTPLCTTGGAEVTKALVSPEILNDPLRLATVICRPTIIRDLLGAGAKLDVCYPKDGFKKRNEEQQKIYREALEEYKGVLSDHPLDCKEVKPNLIGAFYIGKSSGGEEVAFAMEATQANDIPEDKKLFGLWFGEYKPSTPVYERIKEMKEFIENPN